MQYGMVIDLKKCMGCQTCATSCKLANNLPKGVWWNTVHTEGGTTIDTASGTYPDCSLQHYPVACQHCKKPSCVDVCPTGASTKDPENGIVKVDYDTCIGCKMCMEACPYHVRTYNDGAPAYTLDFMVGNAEVAPHQENVVEKCTLCENLIDKDQDPMCVQACVGYARYFGDLDDPSSKVSELIASRENIQLLADQGTDPSVYYLV